MSTATKKIIGVEDAITWVELPEEGANGDLSIGFSTNEYNVEEIVIHRYDPKSAVFDVSTAYADNDMICRHDVDAPMFDTLFEAVNEWLEANDEEE